MTREDIIRMAREAGLVKQTQSGREIWMANPKVLLEFGQLIEAEEGLAQYKHGYAAGAATEREACAKVCDDQSKEFGGVAKGPFVTDFGKHTQMSMAAGAENCAAAIRARGQA